jgi:DNA-binding NtrC family response regulator
MAAGEEPSAKTEETRIIARSTAMQRVLESVARAVQHGRGVIISGEAATGREMIARAIHARGRRGAPFVVSDCARVSPQQLEWELFGPQPIRSAPRTADNGHALERFTSNSRLAQALGGTLFIRRIVDMPAPLQARLARLHRDGQAVLVERGEVVAFDVQIIAAVEPPLEAAVSDGRVRQDLYERLAFTRIEMPPLRDRREDLPQLLAQLVQEVCRERRLSPRALDEAATALLSALPWRDNARELRSVVETLVRAGSGAAIGLQDVLAVVRLDAGLPSTTAGLPLKEARARFEQQYIAAALSRCHGRISEAAEALGIQRTNLYRKMRELKVSRMGRVS